MFKGIVKYVGGRVEKILIHAAAVGVGAAVFVGGNDLIALVQDLGVPAAYAAAAGAAIADAMRVAFLELRTVDPTFQDPSPAPAGPVV